MAIAIEHVGGGTYSGAGSEPNSAAFATITTDGPDRLCMIVCASGRENTSTDTNEVTAITAAGLTFTRIFHDASFVYTDSAGDPSYPVASFSIDVFTAPVPTAVSGVTWVGTMAGDGFVNHGSGYVFSISGLNDITAPFDSNVSFPASAMNTSGSASAPSIAGLSTDQASDMLLNFIVNHTSGGGADATPVVASGFTAISGSPFDNHGGGSGIHSLVQYQNVSVAQSGLTVTAGYSDDFWYSVIFAFTATPPGNVWASTETPDSMSATLIGYPGVMADLAATEILDVLAAVGFTASVGTMAIQETPDTFAARVIRPTTGTLAVTEAKDVFAAAGVGFGVNIAMNITELLDIAHFLVDAVQPTNGVLAATETPDRFQALGAGAVAPSSQQTVIFFVA